ncbi:DUF986 family protein [Actinobacillus delphinicola]|uniref:UPF0266 membrane protein NCTC12871_01380 n=1 Tax=Actinobacillus delphinicola TaxID=51161 RepID=A0A448TVD1_9PAST|nr:DUF986 family protein [Actinobacillus delphinicola]VEJ09891.1 Predicted membrane protein [Actinobacillus delphinicola]
MVNFLLILGISIFFLYAIYDQFGTNKLKGKTVLSVRLKRRTRLDSIIFVIIIGVILYQQRLQISTTTIFLLLFMVLLSFYVAFLRYPQLLFKKTGCYLDNIFIDYKKIKQVNLSENNIVVIDLTNGKQFLAPLNDPEDKNKIFQLLGGKA